MNEFILIRNAYKAPVRRVFDYLSVESLKSPNNQQVNMLQNICDGVYLFTSNKLGNAKKQMLEGDYLYEIIGNDKKLVSIYPPKKSKITLNKKA